MVLSARVPDQPARERPVSPVFYGRILLRWPLLTAGSGQPAPGPSLFVHPKQSPSQNVQFAASGFRPSAPFGAAWSQSSVQQCSVR